MKVLITGGASGLGESITRELSKNKGNFVYFTYNQSVENAKKIQTEFVNTLGIHCDFNSESSIRKLTEYITSLDFDVLINNAYNGTFINKHFNKIGIIEFENEFMLNIIPTIAITQAAINNFRKKKFGRIITILSATLLQNPPIGASIYIANKGYMQELTKIWAIENAKYNISSVSVCPEMMLTNFTSQIDERIIEQMEIDGKLIDKSIVVQEILNNLE